jgi:hypothetical protein
MTRRPLGLDFRALGRGLAWIVSPWLAGVALVLGLAVLLVGIWSYTGDQPSGYR